MAFENIGFIKSPSPFRWHENAPAPLFRRRFRIVGLGRERSSHDVPGLGKVRDLPSGEHLGKDVAACRGLHRAGRDGPSAGVRGRAAQKFVLDPASHDVDPSDGKPCAFPSPE